MMPQGMYRLVKTGVEAGADQIHVSIDGIGERVGLPSLAEATMALLLRGARLEVRTEMLCELSQFVSSYTGIPTPEFKPIVGRNAFRHKSGMHIAAILRDPRTYEPFDPKTIGQRRRVVFGECSGKHAAAFLLDSLGVRITPEEAERVARRLKVLRRGDLFELELA